MRHLILSTAASLIEAVKETELSQLLNKNHMEVFFREKIEPPFDFDAAKVIGVVTTPYTQKIDANAISHSPNLKVVIPFGTGTDHIDIPSVKSRGVAVANVPGANRIAVAELTIGFIFALLRKVLVYDRNMKNQKWERLRGEGIQGKTLGIIGLGHVGKEVAKIALGIGMRVLANDIKYDKIWIAEHPAVKTSRFKELLAASDIISLHVPLDSSTRNMINEKALALIKQGAYLINTARGAVVDERAMLNALESGKLAGAALDVFPEEPPFASMISYKLIAHPRVISSPHAASLTPEAQFRVAEGVVRNIIAIQEKRFDNADLL